MSRPGHGPNWHPLPEERRKRREEANNPQSTVVAYNPVINSGYDPDGLQELFNQDEIDWDGFDWDTWNWVVVGEEGEEGEEGEGVTVGTVADGAEINFDYYKSDPLFQMAFTSLDMDLEDLSVDDLQTAMKYVVETYRMASRDEGHREPWKEDMPEPYVPTTLESDYETGIKIPGIVKALPGPSMSGNLEALKVRSGAKNFEKHESYMSDLAVDDDSPGNNKSDVPYERTSKVSPEWKETRRWTRNVKEIIGKKNNHKDWAKAAGVDNINSREASDKIKTFFREHNGVLPTQ